MIGSLISGAMKIGGSIFGGISASKAMKRVKSNLQEQKQANKDWYDRGYNEDATQRTDAQAILSKTEESIRQRNRQTAGAMAVGGGTEESVAAAKAANNEVMADAVTGIAVNGERRKDAIENQYLERDAQIDGQLNDLEINKANSITQAVQGVTQAGSDIAGLF